MVSILNCFSSEAQTKEKASVAFGTFHSLKGFGGTIDFFQEKMFSTITVYTDMIGIITGETSTPGLRLTYFRNYRFLEKYSKNHDFNWNMYAGPGITTGYVRDTDLFSGILAGVSGDLGFQLWLKHNVCLNFEFQADFAFLLREHRRNIELKLYDSGYRRFLYPQIRINYYFK